MVRHRRRAQFGAQFGAQFSDADGLAHPSLRYAFLNVPPGSLKGKLEKGEGELEYLRQEYAGWSPEVFQLIDNTPVRRRRAIRRAIRRATRRAIRRAIL